MDEGRIAGTDEMRDATEIRHESEVIGIDWRCPGCHMKILPASWKDAGHKVTAYFRRYPGLQHDKGCTYVTVDNAKPGSLGWGQMGTPRKWIDRIDFPPFRPPLHRADTDTESDRDGPPHVPVVHSSTRQSLTGACRFHQVTKGSRWQWKLKVQGVDGSTYFDNFKPCYMPVAPEDETKIWFGDLFVTAPPVVTAATIEISVAGHVTVIAETGSWTDFHKNVVINRIAKVQDRRWLPTQPKPQVYVLATRKPAAPLTFRFSDPRKFALILPR